MPTEHPQVPTPVQPEATAHTPLWERKEIWVPLGIAILLAGAVYFVLQNRSSTVPIDVVNSQNPPGASAPITQESTAETELWVITTKFNTVFIMNAEDTPSRYDSPYSSVREAYESSYASVMSVSMQLPVGLKIRDTQVSSIDSNVFFGVMQDQQGVEYAHVLNIAQKTYTKLFSSVEYPDFELAAINGVSPDDSAIHFNFASCDDCDGGVAGSAVYQIVMKAYKTIGLTAAFRWTAEGDFEYKPVPQGCEAHFGSMGGETPGCEDKLAAASWIQGSWQ